MPPDDLNQDRLLETLPRDKDGRPAIGGISLIRKLGAGGMATVYLGRQTALKRDVAVKVLPFTLIEQEPDMVKRFMVEARLAASLESEHIVRVLDVGCEYRTHYFVMQYVQGESVGVLIKRLRKESQEGVPEGNALKIAIAASKGLAAAHAANVVHRDVKPDNILIPSGNFEKSKLADLGLAKPEGTNTTVGTMSHIAMGTPGYMAPEQAENAKAAGPGADVFAMGATIYAMLVGHAPFRGSSLMQTMRAAAEEEHDPLPETVSPGLRSVVDKCLRKKAKDRYADAKELLAALERVQKDPRAVEAGSRQPMRRPTKQAAQFAPKKNSLVPMAVVGAVLVVAAIVAIVVTRPKGAAEDAAAPKDEVSVLFAQAARLEKEDRLDDALSTLIRIGGIAPDDPRLATMRSRISTRLASSKSAAQKTEMFERLMGLAEVDRAKLADTAADWEKLLESYGRLEPYAQSDAERNKVHVLTLEAKARRLWAMARHEESRGNTAGALEKAKQASAVGAKVAGLDAYIANLEFKPSAIPEGDKDRRLRAYKDFSTRASMESDPALAISLWKQAQEMADSPADLKLAVDRIQDLRRRIDVGESEKRFAATLEEATAARQAGQLDVAEVKYREALQLRKDDPAAKEGVTWAESMRAYNKAMREAETAEGSNDLVHAKEAYERALAAKPNDEAATAKLAELTKGSGEPAKPLAAFKVVSKSGRHELVLDEAKKLQIDFIPMKVPATFLQGDDPNPRTTTFFRPYAIGVTEVTQDQWTAIMKTNPSAHKSVDRPVEMVSWLEVQQFIEKVNERLPGWYVALPTEAQWEYACRAGTRTPWSFGKSDDPIKDYAWYSLNSENQTHPVATRKPNPWGLFDMHGNVWELCADYRADQMDRRETVEPTGAARGELRACRGGSWSKSGGDVRCMTPGWAAPDHREKEIGFRLILIQGENPRSNPARASVFCDDAKKVKMEFVRIQAGAFLMGPLENTGDPSIHEVVLRGDYWLMATEVTQSQWIALMGPTKFPTEGPDLPATNISWSETQDFMRRLLQRTGKLGRPSLPTEAQWEYACRAGTKTKWFFGDDPAPAVEHGWFYGGPGLAGVGKKKPNPWGLHDMSGNVAEWCQDWFAEFPKAQAVDPQGPRSGKDHVIRDGWFGADVGDSRSSARRPGLPTAKEGQLGFRVAIPIDK